MTDESKLAAYREKWREAPQGSDTDGRTFSSELLALADQELLAQWDAMAARRAGGELGWLAPLYAETFKARRVLELGSGLGFDAVRFAERGAFWTCADIVPDNLALVRRIVRLKKLDARVATHLIDDDFSFRGVTPGLDVVWVFGSVHHVPFETAQQEARAALSLLKCGGRWMELVYPRERWLREGSLPFDQWGKLTDGERTPWAEWHDAEKIRQRLAPARFATVLDFGFCADNYRWVDLELRDPAPFDAGRLAEMRRVDLVARAPLKIVGGRKSFMASQGWDMVCPPGLFAETAEVDLRPHLEGLKGEVALDLEIRVQRGAIGIGLTDKWGKYLPAAEAILVAGEDWHRVTLRTGPTQPSLLRMRNLHANRRTRFQVRTAILRGE